MSFEGIDPSAELYNIILEEQFEDFSKYYIAEISFEEFTCKVDVAYRIKHGVFPLMDENYQGSNTSVHKLRADITPETYSRYAQEWAALGADIIGGCCGISPNHIAHLVTTLRGSDG